MSDLAVRDKPLEYWFFWFNAGSLAFLVDYVIRRSLRIAEVRVSFWVDGLGRVERLSSPTWLASGARVDIAECTFDEQSSTGRVADVEWDLRLELGSSRIDPAVPPIKWLNPFDMQIASRPRARFSGQVTVGDVTFSCEDVPGLVSHYWGRRLPDSWWWISANLFEDTDLAVEALLARTRVWNSARVAMNAGYLWIEDQGRRQLVIHPLNGLIRIEGTPESFTLRARQLGRPGFTLRCSASPHSYNDLGEDIQQTLLGTCVIQGMGEARGTAGLEIRSRATAPTTNWHPDDLGEQAV
ncbi:MAG TPA: hypothetical protein VLS86_05880 [Acidimicrobiia bacterium]|nr:hypothetical protein [Acidimicrobiia bacterium]